MAAGEYFTAATEDKVQYNLDGSDLSLAAGYMGSDLYCSVDLGGGRSVFLCADSSYATAAGQKAFLTAGPQPSAKFIRNCVIMYSSYDLDSVFTPESFAQEDGAGNPSSFFPDVMEQGQPYHRWPYYGHCFGDKLLIVGGLIRNEFGGGNLDGGGNWASLIENFDEDPDEWVEIRLPPVNSYMPGYGVGVIGGVESDDGFVYLFSTGNRGRRIAYRVTIDRYRLGWLENGEWWDGHSGWWTDDVTRVGGIRRREELYGFERDLTSLAVNVPNDGSIHQRASDGRYQYSGIFHFPFVIPGTNEVPAQLGYSLSEGTELGTFPAPTNFFELLESPPDPDSYYPLVYACFAHPQMTWTGMGENDQVWTAFLTGGVDRGSPTFIKATDLT